MAVSGAILRRDAVQLVGTLAPLVAAAVQHPWPRRGGLTPRKPATIPRPSVRVSPDTRFGRPTLAGTRLEALDLADRYWQLGDRVQSEILDAYEITHADLVVCCWYAAQHGSKRQRARWRAWLDEVWAATDLDAETGQGRGWWGDLGLVPLPPHRPAGGEDR